MFSLINFLLLLLMVSTGSISANKLYGCSLIDDVCEIGESCVDDHLFGQCQPVGSILTAVPVPELDSAQLELLKLELRRLLNGGYEWTDSRTQCVLAYFRLATTYQLKYDPQFCDVQNPGNIWSLLQLVQSGLSSAEKAEADPIAIVESPVVPALVEKDYEEAVLPSDYVSVPDENAEVEVPNEVVVPVEVVDEVIPDETEEVIIPVETPEDEGSVEVPDESSELFAVPAEVLEDEPSVVVTVEETEPIGYYEEIPVDYSLVPDYVYLDQDYPIFDGNSIPDSILGELIAARPQAKTDYNADYDVPIENADTTELNRDEKIYDLSSGEEEQLNRYFLDIMEGREPNFDELSDEKLDKLIAYVQLMRQLVNDRIGVTNGEIEKAPALIPDTDPDGERMLLKKDAESLGDVNQGLSKTDHKIVKGEPHLKTGSQSIHRVIGNRVYIRMQKPLRQAQLLHLMAYLEESIGRPKNLTFDQFQVTDREVSFRVSRPQESRIVDPEEYLTALLQGYDGVVMQQKRMIPASSVAEAVYKRRKDIQSIAGGSKVEETGVGSGQDNLPIEGVNKDTIVVPTLVVSGLIVGVLVTLFAVYSIRNRNSSKDRLHRIAQDLEGQPSKSYEELCRQRMWGKTDPTGAESAGIIITAQHRLSSQSDAPPTSKTSSTSSWCEEPVQQTNMDISTGHMILSYLESHLEQKDRLATEWKAIEIYQPDQAAATVTQLAENKSKNRFADVLPYDHNIVRLCSLGPDADITQCGDYVNASLIYDSDPRSAVYIATQAPLLSTAAEFWQMIWEQGSVVIVNLTKLAENGDMKCHRYWPENGSEVHGMFEVHLVSEHIWCEDYLVRSFYLKNLRTNETRTVTQFHFLSWPDSSIPGNTKPLLEFRRKVNKSYRGRSCPIVVHCSDGAGRTGTYCLMDMVINRINKGTREMDILATLEHLRDQRAHMVRTQQQYEFVLSAVAEEVEAILKALPQP